ncbi:Asp-tRNA(Asn)/Glu-tRNA(Gln) amidotransferase A subunit family amidase [Kitasatospora gansuensis]|uniref:Asp-tRNA(Asn)/Glu-tRNA(Gln) amidotransferase A subunit family amidase n=1 Tax=Kitasatospora gansuensis TaxID=258050 RepID=A0A7W7SCJ9_9ACTN|nr:amidase [Kitasatospora gansuensis]MBB4947994.1 Asp-tRNA(Asn)/Glu-tRNA(Gln) amidotransferase A subunit family amidase [Kitasatospora gansuensis]
MEPTELVEELCARIDRIDPLLHAFTPEPGRYLRLAAEARELERRYGGGAHPPLYGVPVGIKDVIQVDGLPTHAGSALPPGVLAGPEATVVRRLRAAGVLIAGKTVTAEFALNAPGPTRNPHNPAHTPGGSSSGSAAAVAAGLVPLAIGTQTVGSVIRPAAYCGVVGFRPSYGRIPTDGLIAGAPSLDTVGIFAPDLAGVERAAAVLCDGWRPAAAPGRPPVLGVPVDYLAAVSPAGRDAFERTGLTARQVTLPWSLAELAEDMRVISRYELARVHHELFPRFANLYRPETASAIRHGQEINPTAYAAALRARSRYRRRLTDLTTAEGIDLWVTPAATGPAPLGLESTGDAVMSLPWSHAGWPAISLPAGTVDGLPVGLQLIAPAEADEQLLAWAGTCCGSQGLGELRGQPRTR